MLADGHEVPIVLIWCAYISGALVQSSDRHLCDELQVCPFLYRYVVARAIGLIILTLQWMIIRPYGTVPALDEFGLADTSVAAHTVLSIGWLGTGVILTCTIMSGFNL